MAPGKTGSPPARASGVPLLTSLDATPNPVLINNIVRFTVHLDQPAGSMGLLLTLASQGLITVPPNVLVPEGEISAQFSGAAPGVSGMDTVTAFDANSSASAEVQIVDSSSTIVIEYSPACDATDHAVFLGSAHSSGIDGALDWTRAFCGLGTSGAASFDPGDPLPGELFYFVVVGQSLTAEGSYGTDSNLVERHEATGVGSCDRSQDLGAICELRHRY
jgi:hypothetical protein